ncbi:putative exported protein [Halobacteriovorax marinus SJ]|uniref:Exported protein n=1 Tax=Halobacteriovorax marinus (strain ATCC BAA-682 / DSM 15412 / SJ) TaxID=862908 RepID=E1X5T1_HALMS|nr:putative exported protein [Halobacteriovorax marinus SJ]
MPDKSFVRGLIFSTFCLLLLQAHAAGPCDSSEISAELSGMNFVGKKAIPVKKWSKLPKSLSIHDGEYGRLKFKDGDQLKLTYTGKDLENMKFSKTLEAPISEEGIADIELMKWFEEVQTFHGGTLEFKILKNKKILCTQNMEITGGD